MDTDLFKILKYNKCNIFHNKKDVMKDVKDYIYSILIDNDIQKLEIFTTYQNAILFTNASIKKLLHIIYKILCISHKKLKKNIDIHIKKNTLTIDIFNELYYKLIKSYKMLTFKFKIIFNEFIITNKNIFTLMFNTSYNNYVITPKYHNNIIYYDLINNIIKNTVNPLQKYSVIKLIKIYNKKFNKISINKYELNNKILDAFIININQYINTLNTNITKYHKKNIINKLQYLIYLCVNQLNNVYFIKIYKKKLIERLFNITNTNLNLKLESALLEINGFSNIKSRDFNDMVAIINDMRIINDGKNISSLIKYYEFNYSFVNDDIYNQFLNIRLPVELINHVQFINKHEQTINIECSIIDMIITLENMIITITTNLLQASIYIIINNNHNITINEICNCININENILLPHLMSLVYCGLIYRCEQCEQCEQCDNKFNINKKWKIDNGQLIQLFDINKGIIYKNKLNYNIANSVDKIRELIEKEQSIIEINKNNEIKENINDCMCIILDIINSSPNTNIIDISYIKKFINENNKLNEFDKLNIFSVFNTENIDELINKSIENLIISKLIVSYQYNSNVYYNMNTDILTSESESESES
jgi:hypothetical protein